MPSSAPIDNNLDFALSQWSAQARAKNVSYVIGKVVQADLTWKGDPAQQPVVTVYPLDRLDAGGNQTRLGTYNSLAQAQAAAQADANF
jgi:hypothetical protein